MSELNKENIAQTVTELDISLHEVQRIISEHRKWFERQQREDYDRDEDAKFLLSQDHRKHTYLVAAWRRFKSGVATGYEQRLCFEIHKHEMKYRTNDKDSPLLWGARAYHYWKSWSPGRKQTAIEHIAQMDGITNDRVRKQLELWEKIELEAAAITDEAERARFWDSVYKSKHKIVKKTVFSYKNPFD